ncbi:MAG TPA: sugar phosphate isomerase/epimerase family protein [Chthonomonadales bacterium]|nr:sugar phosphate isomerase/epimerase family protein [Chthonomonadales bacterium]
MEFKKALIFSDLPGTLSVEDRFKMVRDVGFDGVESSPVEPAEAARMRAAAESAGVAIHSVLYGGWHTPLSSGDPEVVEKGMKGLDAALRSARAQGADGVLLVPGVVNAGSRYAHAYERSQMALRQLAPVAAELEVSILVEGVWNNFLLSPLEFARYLDEVGSPWVQAYFDVGNVVAFAWPEDWIRTLGKRIKKVHLKDYKGGPGLGSNGRFVHLGEGSIDWQGVRRALDEVGYTGWVTTELGGGDEAWWKDLAARIDRLLAPA